MRRKRWSLAERLARPLALPVALQDGSGGAVADPLDTYIQTLSPLLYYTFDESSGALVDHGSEGANGTHTAVTYAQTGQTGAGKAALYNATTSKTTIANAAIPNVKALTTQRWAFLCYPDSLGELNAGGLFDYNGDDTYCLRLSSSNRLLGKIDAVTTDAQALSNIDQILDCIDDWVWFFMDYDDADSLGNGRKIRLWKGRAGTLTALTIGTSVAAVGDVVPSSNDLILGNRAAQSITFDGLFDIAIAGSGLWTGTILNQLVTLSGV